MPLFKRSRPAPCHDAPISLTLFNTSHHLLASSAPPLNLLHLTSNTASSVSEAERLLLLKSSLLHPKDREWMTCVIADTEAALQDIAQLIRPARVARPRAAAAAILEIPLFDNSKSPWLLEDTPYVRALHHRLKALHGSLMSVLSVLYLRDLRWCFVAATKPLPSKNERESEASSAPPPAYDSLGPPVIAVGKKPLEKQHQHSQLWNGPQTTRIPTATSRCAIDNPYTWQPPSSPPPPPLGGEKLQHSKSDPTPQQPGHHDEFRHVLYKHENISSSYLEGCRLHEPWTVDFVVAEEEEEGEPE